ncbi:LysR family transcriptional regulator [Bacillus sp. JJ722]|uniref:LysR family transcriptional regulator n=1 Tax=Bacillus sp. JJ722 TaxID=3122973 RepID=UPI002FFEDEF4
MNIEQMQYIVEVARTKSLLAASNNLFVTQSALSQSISNLEKELGMKLFTRSRQGTIPTLEGKKIIKKALEIVIKLQEIKEEAQGYTDLQNSELRIASIPVGMISLVKTVSNFKKDYPRTNFRITEKSSKEILLDIRENKVDLGLIATKEDLLQNDKDLRFEPFWEGKMVIGAGKNSPLASQKSIDAQELLKYLFVLYDEDYVHEFKKCFNEKIGPLNTMFTSNNSVAIIRALSEGLTITCGYDFSFFNSPFVKNGDIVSIDIDNFEQSPIKIGWVRSKCTEKSSISKHFVNRFIHEFQMGDL